MKHKGHIKFALKMVLFLIPFGILVISFVVIDPFMVVKRYDHYNGALVGLNADVVSTEMYLKNRKHYAYNAFIFGNSRTIAYKIPEWKKYLEKNDRPFAFFAFNESLFGLAAKLKFIDQQGDTIKNALFNIDESLLSQTTDYTDFHLYIKDPNSAGTSKLQFYHSFFSAYLSDFFFVKCIDYSIFRKKRKYMNGAFNNDYLYFDPVTNDLYPMGKIMSRKHDSLAFYNAFRKNHRPMACVLKEDKKTIFPLQEKMLLEMKALLDKHKTEYKIIISPNYDCYALNKEDLAKLKLIFGKDRVYDFSGRNKYSTDIHNFYEPYHYTIETGENILKDIYSGAQKK